MSGPRGFGAWGEVGAVALCQSPAIPRSGTPGTPFPLPGRISIRGFHWRWIFGQAAATGEKGMSVYLPRPDFQPLSPAACSSHGSRNPLEQGGCTPAQHRGEIWPRGEEGTLWFWGLKSSLACSVLLQEENKTSVRVGAAQLLLSGRGGRRAWSLKFPQGREP